MKIFLLQGKIGNNGVFHLKCTLAERFIADGHQVVFVAESADRSFSSMLPAECSIKLLGEVRLRWFLLRLMKLLRQESPDLLLASGWPYSVAAVLAIRLLRARTKVAAIEHVDFRSNIDASGEFTARDVSLIKSIGGWLYNLSDATVCVSKGVADGLREVTGSELRNYKVIYNPVRSFGKQQDLSSTRRRIEEFWVPGSKKVLSVGRLARQKSFETLIRAAHILKKDESLRLIIAGEGEERGNLEKLIHHFGLASNVLLIGEVLDPAILYAKADLFVLCSVSEGFANVIVEALSFGLPVVSTNCLSGPAEILENGKWGILVKPNDPVELATAIQESLAKPYDRGALRARAYDFSPGNVSREYLSLVGGDIGGLR